MGAIDVSRRDLSITARLFTFLFSFDCFIDDLHNRPVPNFINILVVGRQAGRQVGMDAYKRLPRTSGTNIGTWNRLIYEPEVSKTTF